MDHTPFHMDYLSMEPAAAENRVYDAMQAVYQRGVPVIISLDAARPGFSAFLGCTIGRASKTTLEWRTGTEITRVPANTTPEIDVNNADPGDAFHIAVHAGDPTVPPVGLVLNLDGNLSHVDPARMAAAAGLPAIKSVVALRRMGDASKEQLYHAAYAAIRHMENLFKGGNQPVVLISAPPDVAFNIGTWMMGRGRFPRTVYLDQKADGELIVAGVRARLYAC